MPSKTTVPEVIGRSPSIISKVVVFPAPFGPRIPKTSPFLTEKETPFTACTPLSYVFVRSITSKIMISLTLLCSLRETVQVELVEILVEQLHEFYSTQIIFFEILETTIKDAS